MGKRTVGPQSKWTSERTYVPPPQVPVTNEPVLDYHLVVGNVEYAGTWQTGNPFIRQMDLVQDAADEVARWVRAYEYGYGSVEGFKKFKARWKYFRLAISLQVRLMVEQILYEKGKPWSTLCTGFQPVGYR